MKKLILLLILLTGAFLIGRYFDKVRQLAKKINLKPNAAMLIGVAAACLFLGIFIGKGADIAKGIFDNIGAFTLPKTPIVKDKNIFVLCDFESQSDIKKWGKLNADLELSDDYVTSGKRSAKFRYSGGNQLAKIAIEKYFYADKRLGDWNGYTYLMFDVYSLQPNSERIKLKIKDAKEKTFQRDFVIPSKRKYTVKIYLSELKASVNIGQIRQLNLFRWDEKNEAIFYIDNLRLANSEDSVPVVSEQAQAAEVTRDVGSGTRDDYGGATLAQTADRAPQAEEKKLVYLLKPDLDKWRVTKGNPVPTSIIKFGAYVSDPLKIRRISFPATGGIPFAEGELKSADNVRVTAKDGAPLLYQAKPTAYWPDGSIKWLLIDTQVTTDQQGEGQVFIEYGEGIDKDTRPSSLAVTQDDDTLSLITGPLKLAISKKVFDLLGAVTWEGKPVLNPGDMYIGHAGKRYFASLDKEPQVEIEVEGPERICIKRTGWFVSKDGGRFCKYILRIEAFNNKPYVRLYHTFIYTGYPENKLYDRYEGLPLPKNETIQEIGILVPPNIQGEATYAFGADESIVSQNLVSDARLTQDNYNSFTINAGNAQLAKGKRANGWVDLKDSTFGIMAAVRYLWEQYPKGFAINKERKILDIKLWPAEAGELDLKTTEKAIGPDALPRGSAFGLGKTHELYLYFHKPDLDYVIVDGMAKALTTPLHLRADPNWVSDTAILGGLHPFDGKRFYDAESSLNDLFDWANRMPKMFNWYGMLDFGDTLSWYRMDEDEEKQYDTWGWHPEGRWGWYNCEGAGTHSGALIQYLRTGKRKYFEFGENLARHIMDVDTCHYNTIANDPRLKGVIDDEVSQVGSMHRHNGDHWGDRNEEATHTNNFGILLYYYLTGYERALEVAKETGQFFLRSPITYTRHPDIAPQRGIANVLWGEMMLYETTRDEMYKKAADKWAKLFVSGQDQDGYWTDTFNPMDNSWSGEAANGYMTQYTLPALIQYHVDTHNEDVGKAIIRAADYLMGHEEYKPYCDAVAYSYWLTGDDKYRAFLEAFLGKFAGWRRGGDDDLHRGMIFQKLIYHRPDDFDYSVPFAFSALAYRPLKKSAAPAEQKAASSMFIDPSITYSTSVVLSSYKIFPDSNNLLTAKNTISVSLAKNEYESAQAAIYNANKKLSDIRVTCTDLKNTNTGEAIAKDNVEIRLVDYVKTKKPGYDVERVGYWPDPLSDNKPFDCGQKIIRPIWVTIYAPKGVKAGRYEGTLLISPQNAKEARISITARVFDFELPNNPSFKTAFDLYPGRMKQGYPKSFQEDDNHYNKRIADIVNRCYGDMIKFKVAPILNLDYPDPQFDAIIQDYLDKGMSAFGVGKYGGSDDNNWPADPAGMESLVEYYGAIANHLKEKGWLDKAYIYTYDEPPFGDKKAAEVAATIHRADPGLKNMVCLMEMQDPAQYKDWVKDIDIFCIRNFGFDYDNAKAFKKMGKELWIYVSGPHPPFPNLAIDFPAMAYRILPWMGWKYDVTGLLYWCVNFWNGDPWVNPMNTKWQQNGNGFLFYPGKDGPVPSLRLYVLRDGIEDYEYFAVLKKKIEDGRGKIDQKMIERAEKLLSIDNSIVGSMADYTKEPGLILKRRQDIAEMIEAMNQAAGANVTSDTSASGRYVQVTENFSEPLDVASGRSFGHYGQFTFELYRGGTFVIDKNPGYALQKSDSYRDSAIIRSANPLPKTYIVSAVVGEIDYDLSKIDKLKPDPEYKEGPLNENGCYLLAIVDTPPVGHHTNDWWHEHRKVCIDVDNNAWGSGMPNPVFMTAYDKQNKMLAYNGEERFWGEKWEKAITYDPTKWYKAQVEKTDSSFILSIYDDKDNLLKSAKIDLKYIWQEDGASPDYLVIGDPHENYYQGSMKIKSITMPVKADNQ